jgi:polysaccharide export outer membrane protein
VVRVGALALLLSFVMTPGAAAQNGDSAASRAAALHPRPGDKIVLRFLRERELSAELMVNERGEATFPKLGVLRVADLSVARLQDSLLVRYAEFLREPELDVTVLRRVVVNGEVRMPNVYMVDGASTVRDVIAMAGGILETGNRKKVSIMRDSQRIPVERWEQNEGTDLRSGDQVTVGRKNWFVMNFLPVISTAVLVTSFVIQVMK